MSQIEEKAREIFCTSERRKLYIVKGWAFSSWDVDADMTALESRLATLEAEKAQKQMCIDDVKRQLRELEEKLEQEREAYRHEVETHKECHLRTDTQAETIQSLQSENLSLRKQMEGAVEGVAVECHVNGKKHIAVVETYGEGGNHLTEDSALADVRRMSFDNADQREETPVLIIRKDKP